MACINPFPLIEHWNREERKNSDAGIMGPPANLIEYCYAVNVQMRGDYDDDDDNFTDVVSSKAVREWMYLEFEDGWGYVELSNSSITPTVFIAGDASGELRGLPLIGFIAVADMVSGIERGGVFPFRSVVDEQ
jgi:hypothetical protein